ncbi:MAG: AAA family ATPase [Bacteroidetes bacterium]|nr:AAA family ATPase [Bacteroidota bacterium]
MQTNQQGSFKLTADQLQADAAHWQNQAKQPQAKDNSLRVRSFNQVITEAAEQPVPQMLFGKFWYEGELCILFSDSNSGKSILAVQIGNSISCGESMPPFVNEVKAQPVLYCDFELTPKQLEARYTENWAEHYRFSDHFYRADLNPDTDLPEGFDTYEDYLNYSIENAIIDTGAKVVIIDNITYIGTENEQAKFALPLMKQLKALKSMYNLSILALAHTPKRDRSKPITSNDLQGSKMLMNFCDSSFAIGCSNEHPDRRYLKQVKQRNTAQVYGEGNVCLFDISKPNNFLQFDFIGYGDERVHLRDMKEQQTGDLTDRAVELKQQGMTLREIGAELGISFQKADRLLRAAKKVKAE